MTLEIAFLLALLLAVVYCFMTELLPVELTAFLALIVLVFTGYVPVSEAFAGFSSPAVITMLASFFLSAALQQTGVADALGGHIYALVGRREAPLLVIVMVATAMLSAFMNNVAAAAVLMPAVASLARRTGLSPGRLFMPLSFGAILGGTTTLVGTPPNLLTGQMLVNAGLSSFALFDFAPIGVAIVVLGTLYMVTVGRRLLPAETPSKSAQESSRLTRAYRIEDRLTSLRVPAGSALDGATLRETRLGTALDVRVVGVDRHGVKHLAPSPDFRFAGGDLLWVDGRYEDLRQLLNVQDISVEETAPEELPEATTRVRGVVLRLRQGSGLIGRTLSELRFRDQFGVLVVGIRRQDALLRQLLAQVPLQEGDELLVLGGHEQLAQLPGQKAFTVVGTEVPASELIHERLFLIRVGAESPLVGVPVGKSRIGELVGLTVVGILRRGEALLAVSVDERITAGDELLIAGAPTRVLDLLKLGHLELEPEAVRAELESEEVRVTEAVIAPRSLVAGSTLRELRFRERYGLQVLAVWREGAALHKDLASLTLRFGDALLLHGAREKINLLAQDADFLVLSHDAVTVHRTRKAPVALGSLALMIGLVVSGLYPIHVAAFTGAVTCVLFGALKMEEAYRAVEWRALFLIAAILPVGLAMESSGAADYLAGSAVSAAESYGPYAFLAALVVLASVLSQGLDGAPTVVILAPIVIRTAAQLGVSPYPLMMAVGLATSAAFMTPFSQKSNLLVMSAGGYRAMDYLRVGTPLTLLMLALIVALVPVLFPF